MKFLSYIMVVCIESICEVISIGINVRIDRQK